MNAVAWIHCQTSQSQSQSQSQHQPLAEPAFDEETKRYTPCGCCPDEDYMFAHAHNMGGELDMWATLPGEGLPEAVTSLPEWDATEVVPVKVTLETFRDFVTCDMSRETSTLEFVTLPEHVARTLGPRLRFAEERALMGLDDMFDQFPKFVLRAGGETMVDSPLEAPVVTVEMEVHLHLSKKHVRALFSQYGTLAYTDQRLEDRDTEF